MRRSRSPSLLVRALLCACCATGAGCAAVPDRGADAAPAEPVDADAPDDGGTVLPGIERLDELGERVGRRVEAERERVGNFPDLPDADGAREAPAGPGPAPGDGDAGPVVDGASANGAAAPPVDGAPDDPADVPGVVTERVRAERRAAFNPYVLTAHRQNFILPAYATTELNEDAYRDTGSGYDDDLQPVELRFQVSLKAQLNGSDLLLKDDSLSFGLTLEAWWQVYNASLSRPFRETNYTPELFYLKPLLWGPFGGSTSFTLGLSHQSNGQGGELSRSWNRIYAGLIYENGGFVARLRPWYRIPEDEEDFPGDPRGDDNPDILDFMGHGDLSLYLRRGTREYAALMRLNTATGHGAARLGYTFPLTPRFRGLVEYFVGYGDSLIDYDHFQQRVGVGIALTDLL